MSDWLDSLHPSLRPLWDLEDELRKAAQNAIFLHNDEAKKHLSEARRHYATALVAIKGEAGERHPGVVGKKPEIAAKGPPPPGS